MTDVRIPPAAEDLVATAQTLWPSPAAATLVRGSRREPGERVVREFAFLPNARRPRLIVPVGVPSAAAAALRRYSQALGSTERYGRAALALLMRTGLGERLLADRVRISVPAGADALRSVEDVLGELLGEPVVVSLGLGNRRANQKPILHVLTPAGETRAFVKVGDTAVTRDLVRGEAAALKTAAELSLRQVTAPRLLGLIDWNDLDLLVLSPLATAPSRARQDIPYAAIDELARAGGVTTGPLRTSPYWRKFDAPDELAPVLDAVERAHGDTTFEYGAWHGDFTPWNLQWRGDGVVLWDWERFATGVPLGFDALHYRQALDAARLGDANAATRALPDHAAGDLARLGVPADRAAATVTLYLVELCARFLLASRGEAGEPLRARAHWLLEHLISRHR